MPSVICPKCGKDAWSPVLERKIGRKGNVYFYLAYRHLDRRKNAPAKCYISKREAESKGIKWPGN
jgi:hypothetical protein